MSNTLKGMPNMPVPYHQKGFSAQQTYVMHTILWQNNPLKRLLADSYFLFYKFQLSKNFTLG